MAGSSKRKTSIIYKNQVHPPKGKGVDELGNPRKKLRVKDGESTMLFIDGITDSQAKVLESKIMDFVQRCGLKMHCKFLLTR